MDARARPVGPSEFELDPALTPPGFGGGVPPRQPRPRNTDDGDTIADAITVDIAVRARSQGRLKLLEAKSTVYRGPVVRLTLDARALE